MRRRVYVPGPQHEWQAAKALMNFFRAGEDGNIGFERYMDGVQASADAGNAAAMGILFRIEELERDPGNKNNQQWFERVHLLGRWGAHACPLVRVDPAWAASMTRTRIPSEMYEFVSPPWPVFKLEIPDELGFMLEFGKELEPLRECFVGQFKSLRSGTLEEWLHWTVAFTSAKEDANGDRSSKSLRMRLDDLVGGTTPPDRGAPGEVGRTMERLLPLIASVCMAFNDGALVRKRSAKAIRNTRSSATPTTEQWVVGRPVVLDLRKELRDYIATGRSYGPVSVQTLVRGHWKHQPHGSGRAERKFIHIEPYWRGPEDAPIAVRPHILKG